MANAERRQRECPYIYTFLTVCCDIMSFYLHYSLTYCDKLIDRKNKSKRTKIDRTARCYYNVNIERDPYIGRRVIVGDNATLRYGVKLLERVQIGKNVTIGKKVKLGIAVCVADNTNIASRSKIPDFASAYRDGKRRHIVKRSKPGKEFTLKRGKCVETKRYMDRFR